MEARASDPGDSAALVYGAGGFVVAMGAAVGALRFAGGTPVEQGLEGALGSFAFGMALAGPGVLALLAPFDRPALLLPAAIVLVPLSFLSMAGVLLPLLVPAAFLVVAARRRLSAERLRHRPAAVTAVVVLALLMGAVAALFLDQDPRTYTTATESGSTSDIITAVEAVASLTLTGAALAAGWLLAAPRRQHPPRR